MSILIFLLLLGYGWARVLPNGCPEDTSIHKLLPHETDCSKYYQCNHGNLALRDCGPGTLFDENLQVCNWPSAVNCDRLNTSTTGAPIASSTPAEPSTTATASSTAAPSPTPVPSSTFAPSSPTPPLPTAAPSSTPAPSPTAAPPSTAAPSPTPAPSSTPAPSPTSLPSSTTPAPPSTSAPPLPNECPSDYKVILKNPQNVDCSKYINCSDGIKLALNCTSKKFFDMDLLVYYKKKLDFHKKQQLI